MDNRRLLLACVWCGPAFALLFAIGFVLLAGFLPPPSPNWRVRLFLARAIKADSVISNMDTSQRRDYEERIRRPVAANEAREPNPD